jgi:uncharacterized surface protein with fasciclin (FAS1) repeats
MTPNTLRMALGLVVFGIAPVGLAILPQQALSDSHTPSMEQPAEATPAMEESTEATPSMEAPPAEVTQSIAEIAASSDDFSILTAALTAAELDTVLGNADISVTVFAPTNDAFEALPAGALEALLEPENRDQLIQLLTYHVVEGEVRSKDLTSGEVGTLAGSPLTVMVGNEMVTINQANVVTADIEASNGVIHVIDSVLLPM